MGIAETAIELMKVTIIPLSSFQMFMEQLSLQVLRPLRAVSMLSSHITPPAEI